MAHCYRTGNLGKSLEDALDTLVNEGKIPGELALRVFEKFDTMITDVGFGRDDETDKKGKKAAQDDAAQPSASASTEKLTTKGNIRGKLDVYRYVDSVWTFVLSDTTLTVAPTLSAGKREEETILENGVVKLVLVDSKIVSKA